MKKRSLILLCSLIIFLCVSGCSSKKDKKDAGKELHQKTTEETKKPQEAAKDLPVFSAHTKVPVAPEEATGLTQQSEAAKKSDLSEEKSQKAAEKDKEPEIMQPQGINPLDLYDYQVIETLEKPYSTVAPDKLVAYWRVINSFVKTKEDNFKQAKIILKKMKSKHPNVFMYSIDINERHYSVTSAIGEVIPNPDQVNKAENY